MTNTPIEALSAIKISIINDEGSLEATITLEEFLRFAKSQHLYFHTNAPRGELDFELTISKHLTISSTKCNIGENNSSKMTAVDLFRLDGSS